MQKLSKEVSTHFLCFNKKLSNAIHWRNKLLASTRICIMNFNGHKEKRIYCFVNLQTTVTITGCWKYVNMSVCTR